MKPISPQDVLPQPEKTALLVIDVQERLAAVMPEAEMAQAVRNTTILMEVAKEFGLPTALTEEYPKGLGPTVAPIRGAMVEGQQPWQKLAFSCCQEPGLAPLWDEWAGKDLILCGIEAHVCVLQTTLDLLAQGRKVYIAADAVCSRFSHNKQIALELMRQAGAVIGSTELFAFGMQRVSGTERFKRISRLVK